MINIARAILLRPSVLIVEEKALRTTISNSSFHLNLLSKLLPESAILVGFSSPYLIAVMDKVSVLKNRALVESGTAESILMNDQSELR